MKGHESESDGEVGVETRLEGLIVVTFRQMKVLRDGARSVSAHPRLAVTVQTYLSHSSTSFVQPTQIPHRHRTRMRIRCAPVERRRLLQ